MADVAIDGITAAEESSYKNFAQLYRASWERMDPVMIGIGRRELADAEGERITLDVKITPYSKSNYGLLESWVGPATRQQIAPVPGDMISTQLVLARGLQDQQMHHIFGGLRDANVPFDVRGGEVRVQGFGLPSLRGYVGAWPRLGLLDVLLGNDSSGPDAEGYRRGAFGSWQRDTSPFTVFSLKRDVLAEVTPNLHIEDAERPAQARLHVADLSRSQLARTINAFGYMRAYQTSVAGSRFINSLSKQLHVPPEESLLAAERLLDARLVCALGGDYALDEQDGGLQIWNSTAHPDQNRFLLTTAPEDYKFPLLEWFRGLDAELSMTDDALTLWAQLDVDRGPGASGPLDFFSLPSAAELLPPENSGPTPKAPAAPVPPDDED